MLFQSSALLDPAAWVAVASLKGTALIVAVTIFRRLLNLATTSSWRHALWLPVLACLICPLGPGVPLMSALPPNLPVSLAALPTALNPEAAPAGINGSLGSRTRHLTARADAQRAVAATLVRSVPAGPAASVDGTRPKTLLSWLVLIWMAGVAALGSIYLGNLLKFRRIRLAAGTAGTSASRVLERCKAELRVQRTVRVLESGAVDSPTVVGWLRPTILLPLGLDARLGAARLRHVLLHELAHIKRNDVLVSWIAALAQLLHWFNPAVWQAGRLMRADMESASDAHVLSRLSQAERSEYGDMLLHLADSDAGRPSYGLGIADHHSDLRARLIGIARFSPASFTVKLVAAFALVILSGAALIQPGFSSPLGTSEPPNALRAAALTDQQRLLFEQTRPQRQVAFSPSAFDNYAGYYRFADVSLFARVYRNADRYYVQVSGKGPVEVFAESPTEFFATAIPAQISFATDGHVTEMTLHQSGYLQTALRVSEAASEAAASRLQQRVDGKVPSPGTQASLRAQLEGWENGKPEYSEMGAGLASASREQRDQMLTMIRYLGALKKLHFVTVNPNGWDVYIAIFSNGAVKCLIAPLSSDGKVTGLFYLP
jgi:beta-lactamase regulating signal transducer with metallopeptidase domain